MLEGFIAKAKVQEASKAAQSVMEALPGTGRLSMRRVGEIRYRGIGCKVEVSMHEQKVIQGTSIINDMCLATPSRTAATWSWRHVSARDSLAAVAGP